MPDTFAVIWLSNGLLLGLLLRNPQRATTLTWLGAAVGYLAADLLTGTDPLSAALLNAANLLGVMVAFYTFRCIKGIDVTLHRTQSVGWLTLLGAIASVSAAILGGVAEAVMFGGTWWTGALGWFSIELFNYAVILPLVVAFPAKALADAVTNRSLAGVPRYVTTHWQRLAAPSAMLAVALIPSWYLGGLGALVFTTPALIAAALLTDVFVTAIFIAVSMAWALILGVNERIGLINPDGAPFSPSTMIGLAILAAGPIAIAAAMRERERLSGALRHAMTQDDLTRAYRRGEFFRRAESLLATEALGRRPTSLLMMDLDQFKRLNDNCGHQAGDRALTDFADMVRTCVRADDLFARLGGEEFVLLVPGLDCAAATVIAERIRVGQQKHAQAALGEWGPTVSIGLACSMTSELTLTQLMAQADDALYRAKALGRNSVASAGQVTHLSELRPQTAATPARVRRSPTPTAWPNDTRASL